MSYLLERRVAERAAANGPRFSTWQSHHALSGDVDKDLSILRSSLPRLCHALLEEPQNYVRVMKAPAHPLSVSLVPSLQAMDRLWLASRLGAAAIPASPASRVACRFTSRLLDVCDQALEWSSLALKHGHFEAGNRDILRDLDALTHILCVTSTVALWHVRWGLLDGSHSSTRSASALRLVLELQRFCPKDSDFKLQLEEAQRRLMLACLLCLSRLEKRPAGEIHRCWALLQDIPPSVLLQCLVAEGLTQGPCIVFAFNDLHLTEVALGAAAPRFGIGLVPVRDHLRTHVPPDAWEGLGGLASLLPPAEDRSPCMEQADGPAQRLVKVCLGVRNIVRRQPVWLEFLAPHGGGAGDENVKVLKTCFGSLRASHRMLLKQCSGNVVAVQPSPEDPLSMCLITSVESEADSSIRLHLQLLSTHWFVDSVQPLDRGWEKSGLLGEHVILARSTQRDSQELLMILEMDLRLPRPSSLPSRVRLKSSGMDYERVGPPRHLWGAVCMKIVPSRSPAVAHATAVSQSLH